MEDRYRRSTRKHDRESRLGTVIMVIGALAAHAALGYHGYRWIRSQSAPVVPLSEPILPASVPEGQFQPSVAARPLVPNDMNSTTLHWSRRDGTRIKPNPQDDWKCAGGYYYSTKIDATGSTHIELVKQDNRPLRCKG